MNQADLLYFKNLLLAERDKILADIGQIQEISLKTTTKEASGNDATYSTHMADQGTDAQEREKAFFFSSRDNRYLQHLNEALERIENGTFGICICCGEEIPRARLEAVPITQHCVPCKEKTQIP